uniref:Uncharacterized protein n=1 Tax=Chromera velia CCMP2878 TaxID=1169474 RepID=A0A0G4HQG1_9ALVE|eukprot:Cvel_30167.t1-p1 / transcript=Cvel_30167.t1 / gene=Cvel_30167 / organism=Chromera_velia_CCMP2878 / gene_product=hypothetical protein / transcript_product=hypothetical protein / location=Cvel_scaffold4262:2355-8882(+) / protein_length=1127 / sequence_SO=supercontig / SO=protein_coding / is_pseudo=false
MPTVNRFETAPATVTFSKRCKTRDLETNFSLAEGDLSPSRYDDTATGFKQKRLYPGMKNMPSTTDLSPSPARGPGAAPESPGQRAAGTNPNNRVTRWIEHPDNPVRDGPLPPGPHLHPNAHYSALPPFAIQLARSQSSRPAAGGCATDRTTESLSPRRTARRNQSFNVSGILSPIPNRVTASEPSSPVPQTARGAGSAARERNVRDVLGSRKLVECLFPDKDVPEKKATHPGLGAMAEYNRRYSTDRYPFLGVNQKRTWGEGLAPRREVAPVDFLGRELPATKLPYKAYQTAAMALTDRMSLEIPGVHPNRGKAQFDTNTGAWHHVNTHARIFETPPHPGFVRIRGEHGRYLRERNATSQVAVMRGRCPNATAYHREIDPEVSAEKQIYWASVPRLTRPSELETARLDAPSFLQATKRQAELEQEDDARSVSTASIASKMPTAKPISPTKLRRRKQPAMFKEPAEGFGSPAFRPEVDAPGADVCINSGKYRSKPCQRKLQGPPDHVRQYLFPVYKPIREIAEMRKRMTVSERRTPLISYTMRHRGIDDKTWRQTTRDLTVDGPTAMDAPRPSIRIYGVSSPSPFAPFGHSSMTARERKPQMRTFQSDDSMPTPDEDGKSEVTRRNTTMNLSLAESHRGTEGYDDGDGDLSPGIEGEGDYMEEEGGAYEGAEDPLDSLEPDQTRNTAAVLDAHFSDENPVLLGETEGAEEYEEAPAPPQKSARPAVKKPAKSPKQVEAPVVARSLTEAAQPTLKTKRSARVNVPEGAPATERGRLKTADSRMSRMSTFTDATGVTRLSGYRQTLKTTYEDFMVPGSRRPPIEPPYAGTKGLHGAAGLERDTLGYFASAISFDSPFMRGKKPFKREKPAKCSKGIVRPPNCSSYELPLPAQYSEPPKTDRPEGIRTNMIAYPDAAGESHACVDLEEPAGPQSPIPARWQKGRDVEERVSLRIDGLPQGPYQPLHRALKNHDSEGHKWFGHPNGGAKTARPYPQGAAGRRSSKGFPGAPVLNTQRRAEERRLSNGAIDGIVRTLAVSTSSGENALKSIITKGAAGVPRLMGNHTQHVVLQSAKFAQYNFRAPPRTKGKGTKTSKAAPAEAETAEEGVGPVQATAPRTATTKRAIPTGGRE